MTRTRRAAGAAAAVLAVLLSGCAPTAPTGSAADDPDAAARFARLVEEAGVPGGALAIRVDGRTTVHVTGEAGAGSPVTADTVFAYRSVTKSLTVTALLQLAEEGLVDLHAPDAAPVADVPTAATPAQLAGMVAGVPNYSAQRGFGEQLNADPTRVFTDDELFAIVAGMPPVFVPGTSYQYSNTETLMIGRILEKVTGQSWDRVVAERVIAPLGLDSVVYPGAGDPPAATATPHGIEHGKAAPQPMISPTGLSAAGGLFGTVADLVTWAEALGTGSLLTPALQEQRLAAFTSTEPDPHSPEYDEYGWGIGRLGDWIGHTGNGVGFQALAMHDPASGVSVAICLNATGEDPDLPAHLLRELEDLLR